MNGLSARLFASVAVAAALGAGARSLWDAPLPAVLVGVAGSAIVAWALLRRVPATVRALEDGLLSLREKDYGLRLAVGKSEALGEVVERFNGLGEALRAEHNDLYQRQLLLETVLDAAPTAIVLCDEAGVVVLANGTAKDLLGQGKKLEGMRAQDLMESCSPELRAALDDREDCLCTMERDGESQVMHVARRFFEISTQEHTLYIIKGMTRELARQEVEVWKKAIRIISHEVNNSLAPITSLTHSARTIADKPEHAHRLQSIFGTIEERALHLRDFLDGYTRFARLPRPTVQDVPWGPFLEEIRALYSFQSPGAMPGSPGRFDPVQMQQVLINLLKNAIESGSPAGDVAVAIEPAAGGTELAVLDRGTGMTDEVLRKALLPFYSTKQTGTGLGLPLCREIVEAHGGRLTIHRREGGGMAVHCWLPGDQGRSS